VRGEIGERQSSLGERRKLARHHGKLEALLNNTPDRGGGRTRAESNVASPAQQAKGIDLETRRFGAGCSLLEAFYLTVGRSRDGGERACTETGALVAIRLASFRSLRAPSGNSTSRYEPSAIGVDLIYAIT
jgi:hypothetical protein